MAARKVEHGEKIPKKSFFFLKFFPVIQVGPDDLNILILVDLWLIFTEYSDLRVGFRVWWPCSSNREI